MESQQLLPDPRTGGERHKRFVSVIKAEKWWVEEARKDPAVFIHYLTEKEPAKHHRIWLAQIFHPTRKRINLIAPRESAKTTILTYAMAYYMGRFPLSTNAIISVAADQAEKRLRMLRSVIGDNIRFRNVFPHVHLDTHFPDTQDEFSLWSSENKRPYNNWRQTVERLGNPKDPTIRAMGVGGRGAIGSRFSGLLLLDDIIDERTMTDEAQNAVEDYVIRTLIPCVQERGKVVNIGTRWMLNDFPERLRNNPAWHTLEIQATLYDEQGQRHSYWPEFWPLEKLDEKRREMNNDALYFIMYENNPMALTRALFQKEQLQRDIPAPLPQFYSVYISTDWALSLKTGADFTVFHALGIDHDNNVYLLRQVRVKTTVDDAVNRLIAFANEIADQYGRLDQVLIETVAFQSVLLQLISKVDPRIPVVGITPRGDKGHRASIVSDWVRRGKFFINQSIPDLDQLISEWMNFPLHKHDDTLDATSLLFQHLNLAIVAAEVVVANSVYML